MHLTDEQLNLYARQQTSHHDDSIFSAHLAVCEACKSRFLEIEFDMRDSPRSAIRADERRGAPRVPLHARGFMMRLNPLLAGRLPIHVLNVSAQGLKLHVPEALERGTMIQVCLPGTVLTAEVRYCAAVGTKFQAGVRVIDVFFMRRDRPAQNAVIRGEWKYMRRGA